jgi:hypothetical protein
MFFFSPFLCFSFVVVVILFNKFQWVNDSRDSGDSINNPNLGFVPPRPGEEDSQVPSNWEWKS